MNGASYARRIVAELTGTALLLATVVGSGIMAEQLAGGNLAIALLANTLATGAALVALILTFGPVSGAHFNPAVSFADATQGGLTWREALAYSAAQIAGAMLGVIAAHGMFGSVVLALAPRWRGAPQVFSEAVATFGLLSAIPGRSRRRSLGAVCGRRIYHCRVLVHRVDVVRKPGRHDRACAERYVCGYSAGLCAGFILGQAIGATAATVLFRWLVPQLPETADRIVVPREPEYAHRDY